MKWKAIFQSFIVILVVTLSTLEASHAETFLYSGGHPIDVGRLGAFGGHTLSATFPSTDAGWADALGGGLGPFDAIVAGESTGFNFGALSASTLVDIAAYVAGGGRIIVFGAHGLGEDDFLNAAFGYGTFIAASACCGGTVIGELQPEAEGTTFADDPATLTNLNLTILLGGAPGTVMYSGADGTAVFMDLFGDGVIGYLGWDFCCGGTSEEIDNWYRVLDSALQFEALEPGLTKELTSGPDVDEDGEIDMVIEVGKGEETPYDFTLDYVQGAEASAIVVDTVPAEWDVTMLNGESDGDPEMLPIECGETTDIEDVTLSRGGKRGKNCNSDTDFEWVPVPVDNVDTLRVDVETRENRGHKKRGIALFAPTSCGPLELNDGAILCTFDASDDPIECTATDSLTLIALAGIPEEDLGNPGNPYPRDGSGDLDGDGLTDADEVLIHATDPCNPETDGDGVLDGADSCPLEGPPGAKEALDDFGCICADDDEDGVCD